MKDQTCLLYIYYIYYIYYNNSLGWYSRRQCPGVGDHRHLLASRRWQHKGHYVRHL